MKIHSFVRIIVCLLLILKTVSPVMGNSMDDWIPRFSGTSQPLLCVAHGNGAYIAVGEGGTILYSTDTVTWIPRLSGITNRLNSVAYGTNGFVVVGDSSADGSNVILSSADGISWSKRFSPVTNKLSAVCYGLGRYVAVGSKGMILASTNATHWTSINTGAPFDFNGVAVSHVFTTVGDYGTILTSGDGLAWTFRFSGTYSRLVAVAVYPWLLVAVGDAGAVTTSPDSTTWTTQASGTTSNLFTVTRDVAGLGAAGQGGIFITSQNGVNWNVQQSGTTNDLYGLRYINEAYLAVGASGTIQGATAWLPQNWKDTRTLRDVVYGGGEIH